MTLLDFFQNRQNRHPRPLELVFMYSLAHFNCEVFQIPFSSFYEATQNELQESGMTISKNSTRILIVTYFVIIVCPPTSTLKLKVLMLKL
jgi:hypothetical protein